MSKRRFLFFDLGKVLVDFDHELMCQQIANVGDVDVETVRKMFFGDGGLNAQIEVGEISQEECYQQFCDTTESKTSLKEFLHAAGAIFELKLDMVPVVTQLVAARQPIGILSNTCQPHWDYVCGQYRIIPNLFDLSVLSYEVRAAKPDRAIYNAAAEMAGYDPSDIFFVDDRADNVEGARAAGFTAVQFTNARQFVADLRERGFRINL